MLCEHKPWRSASCHVFSTSELALAYAKSWCQELTEGSDGESDASESETNDGGNVWTMDNYYEFLPPDTFVEITETAIDYA